VEPQRSEQLNNLESRWERLLASPRWYLTIIPEISTLIEGLKHDSAEIQDASKARLYTFFEQHLRDGLVALGNASGLFDLDRKQIDTIVIHHTSNPPGLQADRLSAIELLRLYGPYFANPSSIEDRHLKGQPIYSGHVRKGKQVFWPYHWIVRADGSAERLLYDSEIGWQAGDWDVNRRSIAIVLDNDYENGRPSGAELNGIARIIIRHYPNVPLGKGHFRSKGLSLDSREALRNRKRLSTISA
jgi:hypothetical protein